MNKTLLLLLLIIGSYNLNAQGNDLLLRAAEKNLSIYQEDSTNTTKLLEARKLVDMVMDGSEEITSSGVWSLRGEIYNSVAYRHIKAKEGLAVSTPLIPELTNPAMISYEAYTKAIELAIDESETAIGKAGLENTLDYLNTEKQWAVSAGNLPTAYGIISALLKGTRLIEPEEQGLATTKDNKLTGLLNQASSIAIELNRYREAKEHLLELKDLNVDDPTIFIQLYTVEQQLTETDSEQSYAYLKEGLERYPDNNPLQLAEVNYLINTLQYLDAASKLEPILVDDPENIELLNPLAFVYDRLMLSAIENIDKESMNLYFDKARDTYNRSLELQPESFSNQKAAGTLYLVRAKEKVKEMVELSGDFSEEGMNQYDVVKAELYELYNQALPYFQGAETIEPNDTETLIALKDTYNRLDNDEMAQEFKSRLENVMSGVRNESYFKQ